MTNKANIIFEDNSEFVFHSFAVYVKLKKCSNNQSSTFLKKKECTGKLSNTKSPERPQKTLKVHDDRVMSTL